MNIVVVVVCLELTTKAYLAVQVYIHVCVHIFLESVAVFVRFIVCDLIRKIKYTLKVLGMLICSYVCAMQYLFMRNLLASNAVCLSF